MSHSPNEAQKIIKEGVKTADRIKNLKIRNFSDDSYVRIHRDSDEKIIQQSEGLRKIDAVDMHTN